MYVTFRNKVCVLLKHLKIGFDDIFDSLYDFKQIHSFVFNYNTV